MATVPIYEDSVAEMRGLIIERSVNIESLVNVIISMHFFKVPRLDFIEMVLEDEYFSAGTRVSILERLVKIDSSLLGKIRELHKIRNVFAHRIANRTTNTNKSSQVVAKGKDGQEIDFSLKADQFHKLADEVEQALVIISRSYISKLDDNLQKLFKI